MKCFGISVIAADGSVSVHKTDTQLENDQLAIGMSLLNEKGTIEKHFYNSHMGQWYRYHHCSVRRNK